MNVFICDCDPKVAAQSLADRHVVKMVTETAQILSTAEIIRHHTGRGFIDAGRLDILYKPTHRGHPCVATAVKSDAYFVWAWQHGMALAVEYTHRYNKMHAAEVILLEWIRKLRTHKPIAAELVNKFPQAIDDSLKGKFPNDTVSAYRAYLKMKYAAWTIKNPKQPAFTNRVKPGWL